MTKKEISENRKQLLDTVKSLNGSGLIEEKIKVVGKGTKTEDLLENFVGNVNVLVDAGKTEELPVDVIAFYNSLAETTKESEPEEKKEPEKEELPNNKKDLRKYIKKNKLKNIMLKQSDSVEAIKNKIKKEKEGMTEKKKEEEKRETVGNTEVVDKAKKETTPKKTTAKKEIKKSDKGPSNKLLVYKEWSKSKQKKTPDELHKFIEEAVKLSTIRGWLGAWKKDNNLPAGI